MSITAQPVGRLTKDPKVNKTPNGKIFAQFDVACNDFMFGKETTTFVSVKCWDSLAERVQKLYKKGSLVSVNGTIVLEKWGENEDKVSLVCYADNVKFAPGFSKKQIDGSAPAAESPPLRQESVSSGNATGAPGRRPAPVSAPSPTPNAPTFDVGNVEEDVPF